MSNNLINIREKLDIIDKKILNLLVDRFELMSDVADAKYIKEKENIVIKKPQREEELLESISFQAKNLAEDKSLQEPVLFEEFIKKTFQEIISFSCDEQKRYLEKKYNLDFNKKNH